MNKILVTGGSGQVGMELQKLRHDDMIFTDRATLDITNPKEIEHFFHSHSIKTLINCAAYTAVDLAEKEEEKCFHVNVAAVKNLAQLCAKNNIKMIHLSSDYVYHPQHSRPIDELDPCSPQSVYASSKLEGERAMMEVLEEGIIIRTSWVYSSFGHNFVKTMLRLGRDRRELNIVADQVGSPTYAGDLAETLYLIAHRSKGSGVYNYSNLGFTTWADFASKIFELTHLDVKVNRISTSEYPTPATRPLNSRLIKSRIADEYDVQLKHWHRSLKKCLEELDN